MKAVALTRYLPVSDPDAFIDVTLEMPVPQGRDILVQVAAVAVNALATKLSEGEVRAALSERLLAWLRERSDP